jgi:NAD(P)H-nitrite reductase large subunit
MALVGIKPESVEQIWQELGMGIGPAVEICVHYVQTCPGTAVCKFGIQDSLGLGGKLEELFVGMELPAKAKIGISGCPMNCGKG